MPRRKKVIEPPLLDVKSAHDLAPLMAVGSACPRCDGERRGEQPVFFVGPNEIHNGITSRPARCMLQHLRYVVIDWPPPENPSPEANRRFVMEFLGPLGAGQ